MAKNTGNVIQDERGKKLYGDKPVIIDILRSQEVINYFSEAYTESLNWFKQNYESDFVRYKANYLSIPGDIFKPWPDANDYFMPSSQITIENYLAREMETVRGGRNFLTVMPRGKNDAESAKVVQMLLRYMFQTPMDGFRKLADFKRWRFVYGTSIATLPWNYRVEKQFIPGVYIWDKVKKDWLREIPEETVLASGTPGDKPPPKDFSGVDTEAILDSDDNFVLRDLYKDSKIYDNPDLDVQEIFNVKLDPNGGPDIQNHRFTIIESVETLDSIKRKTAQGIYDESRLAELEHIIDGRSSQKDSNNSQSLLDSVEGKFVDAGIKGGVRIWTCYGKFSVEEGGFDEEVIAVIAESTILLRFTQTPYVSNGVPYRPIVMDHFIRDPHRPYGIGICQILEQLNYLLNHLVNMILNHGDMHNSPILIYPAEGQWSPQQFVWGPGQSWSSDNSDGFRFLQAPDVKASQIQMITFIEGFIQKTLGINDFTLGSASGSIVNNQTAHGMANIIRETNRRVDFYAQSSNEGAIKDIYTIMLKEMQQFMDEIEIPKITDIEQNEFEFTSVFNKDIQGLYDLEIFADSLTASKEFEQIKSQNFVQVLSQLVDPQTQVPIYDIRKLGDKFIESYGEPFPEKFHSELPKQIEKQAQQAGIPLGGGQPQEKQPANPQTAEQRKEPEGRLGPISAQ